MWPSARGLSVDESARRLGEGRIICVCFCCGCSGRANGPGQSVPSPASTTTPDIHPLTHRLDPFLAIYLQRSLLPYTRHPTWLHHPLHPPSSPQPSRPHHHKNILYNTLNSVKMRSSRISPGEPFSAIRPRSSLKHIQSFYPQSS